MIFFKYLNDKSDSSYHSNGNLLYRFKNTRYTANWYFKYTLHNVKIILTDITSIQLEKQALNQLSNRLRIWL